MEARDGAVLQGTGGPEIQEIPEGDHQMRAHSSEVIEIPQHHGSAVQSGAVHAKRDPFTVKKAGEGRESLDFYFSPAFAQVFRTFFKKTAPTAPDYIFIFLYQVFVSGAVGGAVAVQSRCSPGAVEGVFSVTAPEEKPMSNKEIS